MAWRGLRGSETSVDGGEGRCRGDQRLASSGRRSGGRWTILKETISRRRACGREEIRVKAKSKKAEQANDETRAKTGKLTETKAERKARKRQKKEAKRATAALEKGRAKGAKKREKKKGGAGKSEERKVPVSRVDVSHRIEALLHTMRTIARREEELCSLSHEIGRTGRVEPEAAKELRAILAELPMEAYASDVRAIRMAMEEEPKDDRGGRAGGGEVKTGKTAKKVRKTAKKAQKVEGKDREGKGRKRLAKG